MLTLEGKTIVAVAPHLDDVELGAGGTIHRLTKTNDVYYVGLSLPPLVDRDVFMKEFYTSAGILGLCQERMILCDYDPRNLFDARSEILQLLYDFNRDVKPDVVFIPNSRDIHQSHEVVFAEARRAFKFTSILGYELPWNSMEFSMDMFITLTEEEIETKIAAIEAFETQKNRLFFSNGIVGDLARVRGKQVGREFAECFQIIRLIT